MHSIAKIGATTKFQKENYPNYLVQNLKNNIQWINEYALSYQ